ncbi:MULTISPECIES: GNAT family N-acetyltransferase [unclassified Duganella]|uniref:GNAT family N-acetyltransferase n=1 Tax=unclassified Duganella TaxID=2636909 RepID=UPI000889E171|nr:MULTISPECIES: GNAT family N-acetyltransferase [unclassified Duganella]SDH04893.1 putative acetyltransferase [Duganella sp. OV458]SDK21229.1 putative acetyltransferase [Duganella sp. OV510]
MTIAFETPDQPDVHALIAELDDYLYALYPAESVYALDIRSLLQPNIRFAVARDVAGAAIGCAAVVLTPEYGELKRMYVRPAARGTGAAARLMQSLEQAAASAGCPEMVLEAGPAQPEALAFYTRSGFQRCGPYGDYPDDPHSVFMRKPLA